MPFLPAPRGELTEQLLSTLTGPARPTAFPELPVSADSFSDEDLQLALYVCYELHYQGFDGVDEMWEWEPSLLALRAALEAVYEEALAVAVGDIGPAPSPEEADVALRAVGAADDAPSLSRYMATDAGHDHLREFLVHRSAYQLKEADPHSWVLPRLRGAPKAALVEIQADEYGGGRPERIHADLFGVTMACAGLDPAYGAYLDVIPGATLAAVNLVSLLGLHRRWRGAAVGHLAMFEIGSSVPSARYANGLRRLGYDERATEFFDEHVEADAVHEAIAAVDLAGGLIRQQPGLARDVIFGARALIVVEGRWAQSVWDRWEAGRSSLLTPLGEPASV